MAVADYNALTDAVGKRHTNTKDSQKLHDYGALSAPNSSVVVKEKTLSDYSQIYFTKLCIVCSLISHYRFTCFLFSHQLAK